MLTIRGKDQLVKAQNPGLHEFRATVPDIGPGQPKTTLTSSMKTPYGQIPSGSRNDPDHNRYIKRISVLSSGMFSKPYPISCIRRIPKSLFGEALLVHNHPFTQTSSLLSWHLWLLRESQNPSKKFRALVEYQQVELMWHIAMALDPKGFQKPLRENDWNLRSPGSLHNVLIPNTYSGQTSLILQQNTTDDSNYGETRPHAGRMLRQLSKLEPVPEKPEIYGMRIPNPWILSTDKVSKPQ
ncbi:hypothetical protein PIB30_093164 [Stylosanthes scabra]|uniref:Uncharacterized protein n=1 Tax=Stylosanthes scabra TaxID=79078 RepID=A0ABU6WWW7_9FABA|nr:hypothetical protein [Stylosanthes scabra]